MKFLKKIKLCFRGEKECEKRDSLADLEFYQPERYSDVKMDVHEMAEQSARALENLKMQTACCRAEIDALKAEIQELRIENMNRSVASSGVSSVDTGFGSNENDSPRRLIYDYDWTENNQSEMSSNTGSQSETGMTRAKMSSARIRLRQTEVNINEKLIEAIDKVSQKIPKFIDFPSEV